MASIRSTNRRLERNKRKNIGINVMYIYKTTSRFTSVCKYKLTKMLTFIFP